MLYRNPPGDTSKSNRFQMKKTDSVKKMPTDLTYGPRDYFPNLRVANL